MAQLGKVGEVESELKDLKGEIMHTEVTCDT